MTKIKHYTVGHTIYDTLVLASATVRQTKTRKDYLDLTLTDGKEEMNGKIWNWDSAWDVPETKLVYDVKGVIGEFNGRKQITVESLLRSPNQDMEEFTPAVDIPRIVLEDRLWRAIDAIECRATHFVTSSLFKANMERILDCTAAVRMHHVGRGGLAQHMLEVHDTAIVIAAIYPGHNIDMDLVKAGALLHDIGKIHTYRQEGPVIDYTLMGNLHDHITLGLMMLEDFAVSSTTQGIAVPDNIIGLLQHIIASHHGQREYGSPVLPAFMEAHIVHAADKISATLDAINNANGTPSSNDIRMTDKIFTCGNVPHLLQSTVQELKTTDTNSWR